MDIKTLETSLLVAEVINRMGVTGPRRVSESQKRALAEQLQDYMDPDEFPFEVNNAFPNDSLEDEMKQEVILQYWDKYTSAQIEDKLKQ